MRRPARWATLLWLTLLAASSFVPTVGLSAASSTPDPCLAALTCAEISLTVSGNGNGSISTGDGLVNCRRAYGVTTGPCSHIYDTTGGPVPYSVMESPAPGSDICNNGSCSPVGGAFGGMLTAGQVVSETREFRLQQPELVTVALVGSGVGTVTSTPIGISCASDCSSEYGQGTSLELKAVASASSLFAGWGSGPCAGQGSTCSMTVGTGPISIGVSFRAKPTPVPATPRPTPTPTPKPTPSPTVVPSAELTPSSTESPTPLPTIASAQPTGTAPVAVSPAGSTSGGDPAIVGFIVGLIGLAIGSGLGFAVGRRRPV